MRETFSGRKEPERQARFHIGPGDGDKVGRPAGGDPLQGDIEAAEGQRLTVVESRTRE